MQAERSRILAELVGRHVQQRIAEVASGVELCAFETPAFFDRLQRALMNGSRTHQVVHGLLAIAVSVFTISALGLALASLEPLLIPLALGAYIPLWLAIARNSQAYYDFNYRVTKVDRQRLYLLRVLTGRDEAKEIRAFGLGPFLRARHQRLYDERIGEVRRLARRRIVRSVLGAFGTSGLTVLALGVLGLFYLDNRFSLAVAGTAVAAIVQLSSRLQALVAGAGSLYEASLFLEDYYSFLEEHHGHATVAPLPVAERVGFDALRAEEVTFTYPGATRPAIEGVTLEIKKGEVVALVGENGSGKTTMAKLLAGLYDPDEGQILWDDLGADRSNKDGRREATTVIFQDFVKYLMPAADNIAAGRPEWAGHLDRVVDAARRAGADGFISRLPDGYGTMLGKEFQGGHDLSVGQWQRLALGRAFFRDAPFVILDEPTAALDPRAEDELFSHIRSLLVGRSVLLISHRFSSVRNADRIYVLDGGRIREQGSHDALMSQNGLYAELFTLQASSYLEGQPQ